MCYNYLNGRLHVWVILVKDCIEALPCVVCTVWQDSSSTGSRNGAY